MLPDKKVWSYVTRMHVFDSRTLSESDKIKKMKIENMKKWKSFKLLGEIRFNVLVIIHNFKQVSFRIIIYIHRIEIENRPLFFFDVIG